jgi:hypothetical protein
MLSFNIYNTHIYRNRTLQEMAITLLNEGIVEILKGINQIFLISNIFDCYCHIFNRKNNLVKFD